MVRKNLAVRIIDGLTIFSGYLSGLAILAATLIIVEQVVVRYVWSAATIWQLEISVYLLIAATFLGAPYGLKNNAHINIDMLIHKMPAQTRNKLDIATSFVALLFCIVLSWRGCVMWWEAWDGKWLSSSLLSTPLIYPYAIIPVGMTLTSLQYVIKIMALFKGEKTGKE
jgi:TRAP-type C4-dicarboxylate transport system permease small subunit